MKAPIRWAVHLYPPEWRNRYGAEFGALLEDVGPSWRDFWDVLRGALAMRMSALWSFRKVAAACGLAGALVAAIVAFQIDNRYLSYTVLRVNLPDGTNADGHPSGQLQKLQEEVLSRKSLADLIQSPGLDLYHAEQQHVPMEDIVQSMRERDIRIRPLQIRKSPPSEAFQLAFAYANAAKAQAVTRALAVHMMELSRSGAALNLEVLDPATLPQKPTYPNRLAIVMLGLLVGLATGAIFMAFRRRPMVTTV